MSYSELYNISNCLLSTAPRIKKLYEDWDFGRQKTEAKLTYHLVKQAIAKIYDLMLDEYPEFEADFQSLVLGEL